MPSLLESALEPLDGWHREGRGCVLAAVGLVSFVALVSIEEDGARRRPPVWVTHHVRDDMLGGAVGARVIPRLTYMQQRALDHQGAQRASLPAEGRSHLSELRTQPISHSARLGCDQLDTRRLGG